MAASEQALTILGVFEEAYGDELLWQVRRVLYSFKEQVNSAMLELRVWHNEMPIRLTGSYKSRVDAILQTKAGLTVADEVATELFRRIGMKSDRYIHPSGYYTEWFEDGRQAT